jgi:hypothetical protein
VGFFAADVFEAPAPVDVFAEALLCLPTAD